MTMAERIHALVEASTPELAPRTWYCMPAYARDGKVICFFQSAAKFNTRYATFGLQHEAHLDDGGMWPVSFAIKELTLADEERMKRGDRPNNDTTVDPRRRGTDRRAREEGRWLKMISGAAK